MSDEKAKPLCGACGHLDAHHVPLAGDNGGALCAHIGCDCEVLPPPPPALPGEVFRGEITVKGEPWIVCIAPGVEADDGPALRAWRWVPWADSLPKMLRWRERSHAECSPVFAAWALHEREVAQAERAVRKALEAIEKTQPAEGEVSTEDDCRERAEANAAYAEAAAKLRALGREP